MKRILALLMATSIAASCATTPMTGRRQVLLIPEDREIAMGIAAFEETLANELPSANPEFIEVVQRVGSRLAAVAGRPDYDWEFRVIASPRQNAFALPGGKVAIYEGILPICQNEAGLAVVMSHEIAHVLARHGGERMSHSVLVDSAGSALDKILQDEPPLQHERIMRAYGVGSEYLLVLPYSRKHESEADQMGMLLMARAGYDPSEAPRFWERFAHARSGPGIAEFFSTHPSDDRRAHDLQELLPHAMGLYQQAPQQWGLGDVLGTQLVTAVAEDFPIPVPASPRRPSPFAMPDVTDVTRPLVPSLAPRDPTRN